MTTTICIICKIWLNFYFCKIWLESWSVGFYLDNSIILPINLYTCFIYLLSIWYLYSVINKTSDTVRKVVILVNLLSQTIVLCFSFSMILSFTKCYIIVRPSVQELFIHRLDLQSGISGQIKIKSCFHIGSYIILNSF